MLSEPIQYYNIMTTTYTNTPTLSKTNFRYLFFNLNIRNRLCSVKGSNELSFEAAVLDRLLFSFKSYEVMQQNVFLSVISSLDCTSIIDLLVRFQVDFFNMKKFPFFDFPTFHSVSHCKLIFN